MSCLGLRARKESYTIFVPKPTCLEVFMVNNLVFWCPKPVFFPRVLGVHGNFIFLVIYDTKSQEGWGWPS